MKEVVKYANCFVCGDKNDHGLRARFFFDGREAFCEITATEDKEGYQGIFHGGIISTLLDEVMIKAILAADVYVVTAEMNIRFFKPVMVGDKVRFTGRVVRNKGRVYFTEGEAADLTGDLYATATGKYIEAGGDLKDTIRDSTS